MQGDKPIKKTPLRTSLDESFCRTKNKIILYKRSRLEGVLINVPKDKEQFE